jgi:excisionase family DNA binding protein
LETLVLYNGDRKMGEQLLNPADVAERLNVSKAQAYKMLKDGVIPSVRMGRIVRVRPEDLEKYIYKNIGLGASGEQENAAGAGQ